MQIVALKIKNFLSIADAEIRPGQITQVVGGNNNGKTTVLKAIEVALKGSSDGSLVKHGADQAEIIVEFDEMTVRRRIGANGKQAVDVKRGEFRADAPQSLLNGLLTAGAFNPLELLDPKTRAEAILKSVDVKVTEEDLRAAIGDCPIPIPPIDYSQHGLRVAEQAHRYFYQRRAEANKEAREKEEKARVLAAECPPLPPEPADQPTEEEVWKRIEAAKAVREEENKKHALRRERVAELDRERAELATMGQNRTRLETSIAALERQLQTEKERLAELNGLATAQLGLVERLTKQAEETLVDADLVAKANREIDEASAELKRRADLKTELQRRSHVKSVQDAAAQSRAFADRLDKAVEALGDGYRAKLLSGAKLPIEGLTYVGGQFLLDGCALDNLSTSQAIRLGVALARKYAGKLRVICIDGAEALDEKTYAALSKEIAGDGFVYFVSKVGEPFAGNGSVVRMEGGKATVAK